MATEQGYARQIRIKRQVSKGVLPGATGAQIVRRRNGTFALVKEAYDTADEKTSRRQLTSARHGPRRVDGRLEGLWSPGTYQEPLSAVLCRDFTAVTVIAGASITIAGAGPTYTVTRAAGSWLADGVKIGMGVRLSAGTFNAANLNKNMLVVGATALVLSVILMNADVIGALFAEGPIAAASLTIPGKVDYIPVSNHLSLWHTVEAWHPSVPHSERNIDVRFTGATFSMPGSGNATIDFTAIGLNQTTDTVAYFTTPTPETTSEVLIAAGGALVVNGVRKATITGSTITLDTGSAVAEAVAGSNIRPDVFGGPIIGASGSFTCYFDTPTEFNLFTGEVATSIIMALTASEAANAEFCTLTMSNLKLNSASGDDPATGMSRTYEFRAQFNGSGGAGLATEATTFQIQDSLAV